MGGASRRKIITQLKKRKKKFRKQEEERKNTKLYKPYLDFGCVNLLVLEQVLGKGLQGGTALPHNHAAHLGRVPHVLAHEGVDLRTHLQGFKVVGF